GRHSLWCPSGGWGGRAYRRPRRAGRAGARGAPPHARGGRGGRRRAPIGHLADRRRPWIRLVPPGGGRAAARGSAPSRGRTMKAGVAIWLDWPLPDCVEVAVAAESAGFSEVWLPDHYFLRDAYAAQAL